MLGAMSFGRRRCGMLCAMLMWACGHRPAVPPPEITQPSPCKEAECPLRPLGQAFPIMAAAADASRSTVAVVTPDRELKVFRRGTWRSWPMRKTVAEARCGFEPDPLLGYVDIGLSTEGEEVWFRAMDGSKMAPHRTMSASCLVDIQSGEVRGFDHELVNVDALEGGFPSIALNRKVAALWTNKGGITLVRRAKREKEELSMGARDGQCAATIVEQALVVGCLAERERGMLRIARFDLSQAPAKSIVSWEVETRLSRPKLVFSPGGKLLAAVEDPMGPSTPSGLAVVDAENGKVVLQRKMQPQVKSIELSPATGTMLVAVDSGLQRWSMEGALLDSVDVDCHPRLLFLTTSGNELWCAGYSNLSHYEVRWPE